MGLAALWYSLLLKSSWVLSPNADSTGTDDLGCSEMRENCSAVAFFLSAYAAR